MGLTVSSQVGQGFGTQLDVLQELLAGMTHKFWQETMRYEAGGCQKSSGNISSLLQS